MKLSTVEELISFHCAPTLQGIKVANLVSLPEEDDSLQHRIDGYNTIFNQQGLYFFTLCDCRERRLLLVFRQKELNSYLRMPPHLHFLQDYGYKSGAALDEWLLHLRARLCRDIQFPHEIGLFLGYPLADVKGFIKEKGQCYLLCGEWKVYQNMDLAKEVFAQYACCRRHYAQCISRGATLEELIVAG